jgi:predicted DNA-binding transcriptional regulator AlpA
MNSTRALLEYCDEKYLARSLAVSLSTVRRWRQFGSGPKFVRFGKSVRYRLVDVEEWVAAKPRAATETAGSVSREVSGGEL